MLTYVRINGQLNQVEGFFRYPSYLTVSNTYLAPLFEAAVKNLHVGTFVKDEEVIAAIGWCALYCHGRSHDDATCVRVLEVPLLHGTYVGKYGEEQ